MNKKEYSPYATNKGGMIKSPKGAPENEPHVGKIKSEDDLRSKKRG